MFGSWFYLPILPLLVVALIVRSRKTVILLLIPILFFGIEYGRQFLPNITASIQPTDPTKQLRVMSWNTLLTSKVDGEFYDVIEEQSPDIIALQEVGYSARRKLMSILGEQYPYQSSDTANFGNGLALLSRYPIIGTPSRDMLLATCSCQQVSINLNGTSITVINVHPESPARRYVLSRRIPRVYLFDTTAQDLTFIVILKLLERAQDEPLLFVGDLNTTERQPNYQKLRKYLYDSFGEAGWGMGYTYPSRMWIRRAQWKLPLIRIDHIMHSKEWRAISAWTGRIIDSDHLYIMADLVLE
ncbi:endonuclease/exonuclease/phosphatase family protein [Chloroflexi bacterium TSY]|nr:endonuclease/exonuclease/phosphatase family protein [Chloroflexi bacterium TSY]